MGETIIKDEEILERATHKAYSDCTFESIKSGELALTTNQGPSTACTAHTIAFAAASTMKKCLGEAMTTTGTKHFQYGVMGFCYDAVGNEAYFENEQNGLADGEYIKMLKHIGVGLKFTTAEKTSLSNHAKHSKGVKDLLANANGGALMAAFTTSTGNWEDWCEFFDEENQKTGTFEGASLGDDVGHAIAIIAVTGESSESTTVYKLQNSFGSEWGDNGTCKVKFACFAWEDYLYQYVKKSGTCTESTDWTITKYLKANKTVIKYSDVTGNTVSIPFCFMDTIGNMKKTLSKTVGISPENIEIFFRGQHLDDDNARGIDYGITPLTKRPLRVYYNHYDNSKKQLTLTNKNYQMPNIYRIHGANPLIHKISLNHFILGLRAHNPMTKKIVHYGPFYDVPSSSTCDMLRTSLATNHNIKFSPKSGIFYKFNQDKPVWQKISPSVPFSHQIKYLSSTPYIVLHVQI